MSDGLAEIRKVLQERGSDGAFAHIAERLAAIEDVLLEVAERLGPKAEPKKEAEE